MSWPNDETISRLDQLHRDVAALEAAIAAIADRLDILGKRPRPLSRFPDSPDEWEELLLQLIPTQLTEAERKVCARRLAGYTDREIADDLVIAENTVRSHVGHIRTRLGLKHRRQIPLFIASRFVERAPAV